MPNAMKYQQFINILNNTRYLNKNLAKPFKKIMNFYSHRIVKIFTQ